jgi:flagellar basal-body rod modification protein FlgD
MTVSSTAAASANPFTALTSTGNASSSSSSSTLGSAAATQTASNAYNTFLKLLTTQLQHQDPLNPTNTDTFTSEMIQLSGVEQQLQTNQTLSSMASNLNSITAANGLGYIGKKVTASGATVPLQNGSASWNYTLNQTASQVQLAVQDANGNTVWTGSGDPSSGQHNFSWNGKNSAGQAASSGDYTLQVTAVDSSGGAVTTSTNILGTVTGVDTSGDTTELKIGDISVPITSVTTLTN